MLPLIERITGKKLEPTYTYLSAYTKGADLPPHTDRPDCEVSVSFIIDKPLCEGKTVGWPIYVDKVVQKQKSKGRYDVRPDKSGCIEVDCDRNGIMVFNGTDHIHYRDALAARLLLYIIVAL